MKGPFERLKYDLRRLWECPLCQRRERTPGSVTARFCNCAAKQESGKPVSMRLIGDGAQRLAPKIVVVPSRDDAVEAPPPVAPGAESEQVAAPESPPTGP
jgi:hypothetical protein